MIENTSSDPASPPATYPLDVLGQVVSRLTSHLDQQFDSAFLALREMRMAIAIPWTAGADAEKAQFDSTAVCDAVAVWLEQLPIEIDASSEVAALRSAGANLDLPADVVFCEPDGKTLQRKSSAPIGAVMSAMQIRDNLDQRSDHLLKAIGLVGDFAKETQVSVRKIIARQADRLADDIGEACSAVLTKAKTVATLGDAVLKTDDSPPDAALAVVAAVDSLIEKIVANSDAGSTFGKAPELEDLLFIRLAALSNGAAPHHAVQALVGVHASCWRMQAALSGWEFACDELRTAAENAAFDDGTGSGQAPSTDELQPLWSLYTVDVEREVHTMYLQRAAA